ncbi:MAG: rRNA pseudouridine synthase, partial [Planctomycetes bacterium]|nr:rRNA pseudouridine synthase [Planctomycetota bacterium]
SVGRLDVDSEGLILFTNDGDFSERMTHPRYGVPKNYEVVVRGRVEHEKLDKLRGGVWLAEGKTSGARIRIKRRGAERSYLDVEIREGKNREVRRMFSRIGYPVLRLKRTRIGPVTIRGLAKGRYRFLTKPEIDGLLAAASADGETEVPMEREAPRQRRRRGR